MRDRIPFLATFRRTYGRSLNVSLFTIIISGCILYGHPSLDSYQARMLWGLSSAIGVTVVVCFTIAHRLLRAVKTRLVHSRIPFVAAFMRTYGRSLNISLFSIISCGSILYVNPGLDREHATILWGMFIVGGLTVVVLFYVGYRILAYGIQRLVKKKKGIDFINGLDKGDLFRLFDFMEYERDVSHVRFRNATIFQTLCDLTIIAKKEIRVGNARSSGYFVTDWAKARILKQVQRVFVDKKTNR
ncbi:hypothetical protein Haur_5161 (plasmid) [Herpetosiphon aurantiacus DSM 785]|uniref:Uncharacterized protein n=1 Tax=Herpetosiphon aurantiacus (strain ATCC 23779 / DSM 785 / 114-95) TaxID=316274 RepID=A9B8X5_HERA2|nr:hypothetical protein Haur_5161 [Herpetosiphon aurantiacus DSM 785]